MARIVKMQKRTRYCACPDDTPRDCRFNSNSQCPYSHFPNGRWLWADQFVNVDTGEIVDPTEEDVIVYADEETSEPAAVAPAPINQS